MKKPEVEEALDGEGIVLDPVQGLALDPDPGDEDLDLDLIQEDVLNRDLTLEIDQSLDLQETQEEIDLGLDPHQDPRTTETKMEIDLLLETEMCHDLVPALALVPDLDQEVIKDSNRSGYGFIYTIMVSIFCFLN